MTSPLSTVGLLSMASRIGSHLGILEMPNALLARYLLVTVERSLGISQDVAELPLLYRNGSQLLGRVTLLPLL